MLEDFENLMFPLWEQAREDGGKTDGNSQIYPKMV